MEMYSRLTSAFESSEPLTGIDANFYTHELTESGLMNSGMSYGETHAATLEMQGLELNAATPAQLYQPSIILKYSESFNPAAHP
jgi:filamentous hemagglutinin